jgi:hypothetical protein
MAAGGVAVWPVVAAGVASRRTVALLAAARRVAVPLVPVASLTPVAPLIPVAEPVIGASRVAGAAGGLCPLVPPLARGEPGTLFLVHGSLVGAAAGTAGRCRVGASSRRLAATVGRRLPRRGAWSVRVAVA